MKLVFGLALLAVACGSKPKNPVTEDDAPCKKSDLACNTYMCGGNSAIVNAFPLNGWRSGECSPEGIKVLKGSLQGVEDPTKCEGQTLDIKEGKLIGIKADGTDGCVGAALKATSFAVIGTKKTHPERIEITDVNEHWTAPPPNDGIERTVFQMQWADQGHNKWGLCSKDGQKLRHQLGLPELKDSGDIEGESLVIPLVGEVYGEQGEVSSGVWNQLACVDDALAKRSLYQLEHPDQKKNRAALRMLVADYCGSTAWTKRGEWIQWDHTNGTNIEAQWNENRATCLTNPRLLLDDNDQPTMPVNNEHLKHMCKHLPGGCNTREEWMTEMKTCRKPDGSVDFVLPECSACSDPNTCQLSSKNAKPPPKTP